MKIRFFGFNALSANANPPALSTVMPSSIPIHFGIGTSAPAAGRARHSLTATNRRSTPSTNFNQYVHSAGPPSSLAPVGSASASRIAPTTATPTTHPSTNTKPFTRAFGVINTKTIATIGVGLNATPTANGNNPPIACPNPPPVTRLSTTPLSPSRTPSLTRPRVPTPTEGARVLGPTFGGRVG